MMLLWNMSSWSDPGYYVQMVLPNVSPSTGGVAEPVVGGRVKSWFTNAQG